MKLGRFGRKLSRYDLRLSRVPSFTKKDQRKPRKSLSGLPVSGVGISPGMKSTPNTTRITASFEWGIWNVLDLQVQATAAQCQSYISSDAIDFLSVRHQFLFTLATLRKDDHNRRLHRLEIGPLTTSSCGRILQLLPSWSQEKLGP